jgi:hypothetical protein
MFNRISPLKKALLLPPACAVAFGVGILGASFLARSDNHDYTNPIEGFDFKSSSDAKSPSRGPENGKRINLTRLRNRNGEALTNLVNTRLIMLVTVDPECGACRVAADEMRDIQRRLKPLGIKYYAISVTAPITSSRSPADFFSYTDSLGLNAPGFLWANNEEKPDEALFTMVLPSHLLLDSTGAILHKWPGTDQSPQVRRSMANQIVADTLDELKLGARATQF